MGFSRQEHCSGLPFPSPENLPNLGIEPMSPAWQEDSFFFFPFLNHWAIGKPHLVYRVHLYGFCVSFHLKKQYFASSKNSRSLLYLKAHFLFFFSFIFISWRLITLQYCSDFCHTLTWISHGFICVSHPDPPLPPPAPSHPSGSSQCTSPEHLSHASNLGWWSVSHLIVYLFQCYFKMCYRCLLDG